MMDGKVRDEIKDIAIGFSYKAAVGDGRELVLQSAVPFDAGLPALHAALDRMREGCDRQIKFGKIESLDAGIEQQEGIIRNLEEGIKQVDDLMNKRAARGQRKELTNQEAQGRDQAMANIEATKGRIEQLKKQREALRASLKE